MLNIRLSLLLTTMSVLAACEDAAYPGGPNSVEAPPAIVSFGPDTPLPVAPGEAITLTWNVQGVATTLMIEPDVGPVSGTQVEVRPSDTTTYVLTATNALGSVSTKTTVEVEAPPVNVSPGAPAYPPSTPETPYGEWVFEIALEENGKAFSVSGTVSLDAPFAYDTFEGVWGEVTACEGKAEVCGALNIGGIYRDAAEDVLKFSLGTYDIVPVFVGIDDDRTVEELEDGSLMVEGTGEVTGYGESKPSPLLAAFKAHSVLP